MRFWLWISLLALSTGFGILVHYDPGYALFAWGQWTVEMPLWLTIMGMTAIIIGLFFITWMIQITLESSAKIKLWWKNHQQHSARLQTYHGLLEMAEGRWQDAERYLAQSASLSEQPLINYLSAARAAEELGAFDRRDKYLDLASQTSQKKTAVRITQTQMRMKHGDWQKSLEDLEDMHHESPKHPEVLRLLAKVYEQTHSWSSLLDLLPQLSKKQVLDPHAYAELEQRTYKGFIESASDKSLSDLQHAWKKVPKDQQSVPVIIRYTQGLIRHDAHSESEKVLRTALNKHWHAQLLYWYGFVKSPKPKEQLQYAESFVNTHSEEPFVFLTLGRICLTNQLWGKAKEYLERSLALKELPETCAELGQLMGQLSLTQKENEYFRKGLLLTTQTAQPQEEALVCVTYEDR